MLGQRLRQRLFSRRLIGCSCLARRCDRGCLGSRIPTCDSSFDFGYFSRDAGLVDRLRALPVDMPTFVTVEADSTGHTGTVATRGSVRVHLRCRGWGCCTGGQLGNELLQLVVQGNDSRVSSG